MLGKKVLFTGIFTFVLVVILCGCVSTIPISTSINDFVVMGIKTNSSDHITFEYSSNIQDGVTKFYKKDKTGFDNGHNSYDSTESATFSKMITEYISSKFTHIEPNSGNSIKIILQDFWVEFYTNDPAGLQLLAIGNSTSIYKAVANIFVTIKKDGEEFTKTIQASSEEEHHISTSIYQQKEQWESVVAKAINNTNNKILMLLNSYLEELQL
jgi:hypothetical protein